MANPPKFRFEVSFDDVEGAPTRRGADRRFTRAEIEATRQAALAEGRTMGLAEAEKEAAMLTARALDAIATGAARLVATHDATIAETERTALLAVRAILAKTLPGLAAKDPLAEVEAFAVKTLHDAIDEPRLVLRVAAPLYEPVRGRLDAVSAASGFGGRIVLLADDAIAAGDARVEWADGGAERVLARQLKHVEAAFDAGAGPHEADALSPLFPLGD